MFESFEGPAVDLALAALRAAERDAAVAGVAQWDAALAVWESTPADTGPGRGRRRWLRSLSRWG